MCFYVCLREREREREREQSMHSKKLLTLFTKAPFHYNGLEYKSLLEVITHCDTNKHKKIFLVVIYPLNVHTPTVLILLINS